MSCHGANLNLSGALKSKKIPQSARYFRVLHREPGHTGLGGGEGGIRTPETLSSLHAFQACALNRARPPLRARTAIMHHARPRSQFRSIRRAALAKQTRFGVRTKVFEARGVEAGFFRGLVPSAEFGGAVGERTLHERVSFGRREGAALKT
jgi:hypothetical protein